MAGPGGSKLVLSGFAQNLSKMLCRRGAGSGASRIFVFHSFSRGLRAFPGVGEGLGYQGSSQPVPVPLCSSQQLLLGLAGLADLSPAAPGHSPMLPVMESFGSSCKASPGMAVLGLGHRRGQPKSPLCPYLYHLQMYFFVP